MVKTVEKRRAWEHETVEDHATVGAAVLLAALVVVGLASWGVMRGVALPIGNTMRLGALVVGGGFAFACLIYRPQRRRWWRNGAFVLALATSIVGIGVLPSHVELEVRAHEQALTAAAEARLQQDPSGTSGCSTPSAALSAGDLGPFESVCVIGIAPRFAVEFDHRTDATHTDGLVYAPGPDSIRPASTCVQHLYGPWFEIVRPADPNCPFGFEYTGAP